MGLSKDAVLSLRADGFKEAEARIKAIGRALERAVAMSARLTQQGFNLGAVSPRLSAAYTQMIEQTGRAAEAGRAMVARNMAGLTTAANAASASAARAFARVGTGVGGGAAASMAAQFKTAFDSVRSSARSLAVSFAAVSAGAFGVFKLLEAGNRVENVASGFENLSGRIGSAVVTLGALERATGGGVTKTGLMIAANRILAAKLDISRDRMATLFSAASRLARVHGITAAEGIERLSLALAKQEPELLDELGLKVDLTKAVARYARENNIAENSIDAQARAQIFLNEVARIAIDRSRGLGDGAFSAASASAVLSKKWGDMKDRLALLVAQNPAFVSGLESIATSAIHVATALVPLLAKLAELASWIAKLGPAIVGWKLGAAAGSIFGPVGTAVGGAIGAVGGGILGEHLEVKGRRAQEQADVLAPVTVSVNVSEATIDRAADRAARGAGDAVRGQLGRLEGRVGARVTRAVGDGVGDLAGFAG